MSEPTPGPVARLEWRPRRPRRPHAQPEGRRPDAAASAAHRLHGRQRVGEVLARLRHDLRRRAAALRRVAVGLRPAVPRADGEAGRRRRSTASRRRSRFGRRTASAIRDRRSARRPRSTTTCGCSGRASAGRSAGSAASRSSASRPTSSRRELLALPAGTRLLVGFDYPVVSANGVFTRGDGGA